MDMIASLSVHTSNITGKPYLRFYENSEDGSSSDRPIEVEELEEYVLKLLEKINEPLLNTKNKKQKE
jgi:hypothetical protein